MESEKSQYLRRRGEESQNAIININSATTATFDSYTWTFRTTSCDVISLITTTVPLKGRSTIETNPHNKEAKRLRIPLRKPGTFLSGHPLQGKFVLNEHAARLKKNEALWLEHKSFMKKLRISRYLKSAIEALAATNIQKVYRGYSTRMRKEKLRNSCLFRKRLREQIREFVASDSKYSCLGLVLTHGEHRKRFKEWQYRAALCIQRSYRCYSSKAFVCKRRTDSKSKSCLLASTKLQCFARSILAKKKVACTRQIRLDFIKNVGARLLQNAVRCFIARRKVFRRKYKIEWLAARIIQSCYRIHRVKALLKVMTLRTISVKNFNGALLLQCLIRRRIAYCRVHKLSAVRFLYRVHIYATRIQSIVRGFIRRSSMKKIQNMKAVKIRIETKPMSNIDLINAVSKKSSKKSKASRKDSEIMDDLDISRHKGILKGSMSNMFKSEVSLISAVVMLDVVKIESILSVSHQTSELIISALTTAVLSYSPSQVARDILHLLLRVENGKYINELHKDSGESVLHLASQMGLIDVAQILLAYGALADEEDTSGYTALHRACQPTLRTAQALPMVFLLLGIKETENAGWEVTASQNSEEVNAMTRSKEIKTDESLPETSFLDNENVRAHTDNSAPFLNKIVTSVRDSADLMQGARKKVEEDTALGGVGDMTTSSSPFLSSSLPPPLFSSVVLERDEYVVRMASALSKRGKDGKNCLLLAAISGQTKVLQFAQTIVDQGKVIMDRTALALRREEAARLSALKAAAVADLEAIEMQASQLALLQATAEDETAERLLAEELDVSALANVAVDDATNNTELQRLSLLNNSKSNNTKTNNYSNNDNISNCNINSDGVITSQDQLPENAVNESCEKSGILASLGAGSTVLCENLDLADSVILTPVLALYTNGEIRNIQWMGGEDGKVGIEAIMTTDGDVTISTSKKMSGDNLQQSDFVSVVNIGDTAEKEEYQEDFSLDISLANFCDVLVADVDTDTDADTPVKVEVDVKDLSVPVVEEERVWSRKTSRRIMQLTSEREKKEKAEGMERIEAEAGLEAQSSDDVDVSVKDVSVGCVVWSEEDTHRATELAKSGDAKCLSFLLDASNRLPPSPFNELTLAMVAATEGNLPVLDMFMSRGIDFSEPDKDGRTVLHHGASCSKEEVIAYLLTHQKTKICNILEDGLATQDMDGSTPLHIAAKYGVVLYLDLLVPKGIELALAMRDSKGLTPLLVACSYREEVVIKNYLELGSDSKSLDNCGNSAIWHLYHPSNCARSSGKADSNLRPIASEWAARVVEGNILLHSTSELARIASEVGTIASLLQAGCPLFSTPYCFLSSLSDTSTAPLHSLPTPRGIVEECCDTATKELSVTLFKCIPRLLCSEDCWRVVLSSIRLHDDVSASMFCALMSGGAAERMLLQPEFNPLSPEGVMTLSSIDPSRRPLAVESAALKGKAANNLDVNVRIPQGSVEGLRTSSGRAVVADLHSCFFAGLTVGGWAVRLGSLQVVEHILSHGYDPTKSADILGNNMIHLAAKYGSTCMVQAVCAMNNQKHEIDYEATNHFDYTAAMEGAKSGNMQAVKTLIGLGANARSALDGNYCAWLLSLIHKDQKEKEKKRRFEKGEKKTRPLSPIAIDESTSFAILNCENLMRKKDFILNSYDIDMMRKRIRQLIADEKI